MEWNFSHQKHQDLPKDKIHPRIKETAKRLWLIYVSLTLVQTLLLWWADMSFFDAFNHALTTISTGGFSTKQASIGHFTSPLIHYIVIAFMFLGGTSFTLLYLGAKLKFKKFLENDEFKWYISSIFLIVLVLIIVPAMMVILKTIFDLLYFRSLV